MTTNQSAPTKKRRRKFANEIRDTMAMSLRHFFDQQQFSSHDEDHGAMRITDCIRIYFAW